MSDEAEDGGTWALELPFDSDDPEFTRGFEAGVIWHATEGGQPWSGLAHAENAEMVMRIAEARGLPFSGRETAPGWMEVAIGGPAVES